MNKVRQIKFVYFLLIVAFVATSTVARSLSSEASHEAADSQFLHATPDTPYAGDHQLPFEEKEKEFEDKSESDKNDAFDSNFYFICEVRSSTPAELAAASGSSYFNISGLLSAHTNVPLFLSKRTILV